MRRLVRVTWLSGVVVWWAFVVWAQAPQYQVVDLGFLTRPVGINNRGEIVAGVGGGSALYRNGRWSDIPGFAWGIDDQSVIFGSMDTRYGPRAYTFNGQIRLLPAFPGASASNWASSRCPNGTVFGGGSSNTVYVPLRWKGQNVSALESPGVLALIEAVGTMCLPVGRAEGYASWWSPDGAHHYFAIDQGTGSIANTVNSWGIVGGGEGRSPMLWDFWGHKLPLALLEGREGMSLATLSWLAPSPG
jgi:hypothetical protein